LIGDVILPGLGTAAGLLFGAYGGRKHAEKKRKRRGSSDHRGSSERERSGDGWDEGSGTFKKGWAVR